MTFKAKTTKNTVIPLLALGVQRVKYVSHYKYLGIVLDIDVQMTKTFRDNCDINIMQQTSSQLLFPDVRTQ